ncbi:hypothetical protein [Streptomyces boluensis]|uniref:Uncharacterized protein n=1 Tax=Streptomyces boluensis TaxID=1775135 RepID=A0A964UM73_9ACTN|nr:hypothetical protein [Streptomyces boluensis]NBE51626.1 hypothetical protein [Streptomyces boluensis]
MSAQLHSTARQLAAVLWQRHTVYRERTGGVVIRGEHVERWISLAAAGTRGEVLIRAGRILDGGTTAPARTEAVVPLASGTHELAAVCRRLLADITVATEPPPAAKPNKAKKVKRPEYGKNAASPANPRRRRRTASWVLGTAAACTVVLVVLTAYSSAH